MRMNVCHGNDLTKGPFNVVGGKRTCVGVVGWRSPGTIGACWQLGPLVEWPDNNNPHHHHTTNTTNEHRYDNITIRPTGLGVPGANLTSADCSIVTPHGVAASAWTAP